MGKKLGTYYTYETPDGKFKMIRATDKSMLQRFLSGSIVGYKKTFLTRNQAKKIFEDGRDIMIGYLAGGYNRFFNAEAGEDFEAFDQRVRKYFNNPKNIKYREPLDRESLKIPFKI